MNPCAICGRALKTEKSRAAGMGPVCRARLDKEIPPDDRTREVRAAEFDLRRRGVTAELARGKAADFAAFLAGSETRPTAGEINIFLWEARG
jgi:hypothetical protein